MLTFTNLTKAGAYHGITSSLDPYVTKEEGLSKEFLRDFRPVQMEQVHQNLSMMTIREDEGTVVEGADALVTDIQKQLLIIRTADCVPILLYEPTAKVVGAIHGGRKSIAWGIVKQAIDQMKILGAVPEKILVGIGPHIRVKNYEIGGDVLAQIGRSTYKNFVRELNGKSYFDLTEAVFYDLVEENILLPNIEDCGIDTYEEYEKYFSYRRWTHDKKLYGGEYRTFGSFIGLA